jgi:iron complex outermembrane recepter protein
VPSFLFFFSRLISLACRRKALPNLVLGLALAVLLPPAAFGQSSQVAGVVTDPSGAVVAGASVSLTQEGTHTALTSTTNGQGAYQFPGLVAGEYTLTVKANGFRDSSAKVVVATAQTSVIQNVTLGVESSVESVQVSAGSFENAYRVDNVAPASPLGTTPIVNLPLTVNVISHQLIADTMARNFKQVAKYDPLIFFQEMQGPEVLRPETRGMQGTNMQGDLMDGMGFAVTVPFALEEYDQIEIVSGVAASMYGPSNPSGMFNFVTKAPTDEPLREAEVEYEGRSVVTGHADLSGRLGPDKFFGYRINGVLGDGTGYVPDSQLRRQLAAGNFDIRPFAHTTIGGNYNYYNLYQFGYQGWFSYNPTLNPTATCTTTYKSTCFSKLPVQAPNPALEGYGQPFLGSNTNNQIGEVRANHDFSQNWHLNLGVLQQISVRNLTTAVNALFDSTGDYQTEPENQFQTTISGRFQVKSDLGYLTGRFKTGRFIHNVVMGSTGYKFSTWQPENSVPAKFLCNALDVCYTNINNPQVDVSNGYTPYTGEYSLYVSSIIHQQGFNFGDTIALTPRWMLRAAASQDWTWTNNYKMSGTYPSQEHVPSAGNYMYQGVSPSGSVLYKPANNQTAYITFADSIQAPDTAAANSTGVIVTNASQPLPPYRSTEVEAGYKVQSSRINFETAVFRIRRPFADLFETSTTTGYNCGGTPLPAGDICENDQIIGQQINFGAEAMLSGNITRSLRVIGGITAVNPKLTNTFVLLPVGNQYASATCQLPKGVASTALICPSTVTNNKVLVGDADYQSNILSEYQLPALSTAFFTFDWHHVGRRPADDMNSYWVPQYNTFDLGGRYSARVFGKLATWLVTFNNVSNVHYWSTLGPGSITGQSSADLAHMGEPRLITASMRYEF